MVAWENSRRFARSPLEPSQNDVSVVRCAKGSIQATTEDTLVGTLVPFSLPQCCVPVGQTAYSQKLECNGRSDYAGKNLNATLGEGEGADWTCHFDPR